MNSSRARTPTPTTAHNPYLLPLAPSLVGGERRRSYSVVGCLPSHATELPKRAARSSPPRPPRAPSYLNGLEVKLPTNCALMESGRPELDLGLLRHYLHAQWSHVRARARRCRRRHTGHSRAPSPLPRDASGHRPTGVELTGVDLPPRWWAMQPLEAPAHVDPCRRCEVEEWGGAWGEKGLPEPGLYRRHQWAGHRAAGSVKRVGGCGREEAWERWGRRVEEDAREKKWEVIR
jgi:hypothetical protein